MAEVENSLLFKKKGPKELKSAFIGLNIAEDDVEKVDNMTEYLFLKGEIAKKSRAEGIRWCLTLGFLTSMRMMENDLGISQDQL